MRTYKTIPILERLEKYSSIAENGCREWTGAMTRTGYGRIKMHGKTHRAHRIAYVEMVAPIPDGMTIDHLCRNKKCINTNHLEVVTHQENTRRYNATRTHCFRGHEFDEENTRLYRGSRFCRKCGLINSRIHRSKPNV